jgi:cell envelope-related function transcriptional attenuator common domain
MKSGNDKRKISLIPESTASAILMLFTLLAEILFIALIMAMDILPIRFFAAAIGIIILMDIVMFLLINSRSVKKGKRLTGALICGIILVCTGFCAYFTLDTYLTMERISNLKAQPIAYDVIVLKDSAYSSLEDIAGQTVYTVPDTQGTYQQAKSELEKEVAVTIEEETGCMNAGQKLMSLSGTKNDRVLFISDAEYVMTNDIIEGFGDETKVIHQVMVEGSAASSRVVDVTRESFNVLISGVDTRGGINDVSRSDVNMILTVNPRTETILLTSMPRDSYVPLHMNGQMDKLTHTGVYGIDETINTIEDWLDVDINYYVRVDFGMLVNLVDAVGGIDVYNDIDFMSSPKGWHYKKGWHHMEGRYALWFVRERKAFKDQDEQRIKNQQKVVKALLKKFTSKKTLVANYTEILKAVSEDMQTSMSQEEMASLAKMQLDRMPEWTIKRQWVDGNDAFREVWSMGTGREFFVSVPKEKSVQKVSETIKEVMTEKEGLHFGN